MIKLKVAYNDNSEKLIKKLEEIIPTKYAFVELETYHEELFKERKKAFKLKGGYSARKSPFAVLLNTDNVVIKVFYSESNDCTYEKIINTLNGYVPYEECKDHN